MPHAPVNKHLFGYAALDLILQIGEYIYGTLVIEAASGVVEPLESLRCIQFIQGFLDVPTIALHQHTDEFGGEAFYLKLDIVAHSSVLCNRLIALGVPKKYCAEWLPLYLNSSISFSILIYPMMNRRICTPTVSLAMGPITIS